MMIRIVRKKMRIIIRVNITITINESGKNDNENGKNDYENDQSNESNRTNIIITIKLRIIRTARVITIIIRMSISAMTIGK